MGRTRAKAATGAGARKGTRAFLVRAADELHPRSRPGPLLHAQVEDAGRQVKVYPAVVGLGSRPLYTLASSRLRRGWLPRDVHVRFIAPASIPGEPPNTLLLLHDGQRIALWDYVHDGLEVLQPEVEGTVVFLSLVSLRNSPRNGSGAVDGTDGCTLVIVLMADGHLFLIPHAGFDVSEVSCVKAAISSEGSVEGGQLCRISEHKVALCSKAGSRLILTEIGAVLVPTILGYCELASVESVWCVPGPLGEAEDKIQIFEFYETVARCHHFDHTDGTSVISHQFDLPHRTLQAFATDSEHIVLFGDSGASIFDIRDSSLLRLSECPPSADDTVLDKTVLCVLDDTGLSKHPLGEALVTTRPASSEVRPDFIHAFNIMKPFELHLEPSSLSTLALICETFLERPPATIESWSGVSLIWDGINAAQCSEDAKQVALVYTMLVFDEEKLDSFCLRYRIPARIRTEARLYHCVDTHAEDDVHAAIFDVSEPCLFPRLLDGYKGYRMLFSSQNRQSRQINLPSLQTSSAHDFERAMETMRRRIRDAHSSLDPAGSQPAVRTLSQRTEEEGHWIRLERTLSTPRKPRTPKTGRHPKPSSKLANIVAPGSSSSLLSTPQDASSRSNPSQDAAEAAKPAETPLDQSIDDMEGSVRHSPRLRAAKRSRSPVSSPEDVSTDKGRRKRTRTKAKSGSDSGTSSLAPSSGDTPKRSRKTSATKAADAKRQGLLKTPTKPSKTRSVAHALVDDGPSPSSSPPQQSVRRSPRKKPDMGAPTPSIESMDEMRNVTVRRARRRKRRNVTNSDEANSLDVTEGKSAASTPRRGRSSPKRNA